MCNTHKATLSFLNFVSKVNNPQIKLNKYTVWQWWGLFIPSFVPPICALLWKFKFENKQKLTKPRKKKKGA